MSLRYGVVRGHGSKDWYAHVALGTHSRSNITAITHYKRGQQILPRVPSPSPDDVVSGLTFGFWSHLLDLKKDIHNKVVEWGPILVDVLPGHRQRQATYWAKLKYRDALFARLDLCIDASFDLLSNVGAGPPKKDKPLSWLAETQKGYRQKPVTL